jgi:signal transduction histidine kinase
MALNRLKIILVTLVLLLGASSYFYTDFLIRRILDQERQSVELWAKAIEFNSRQASDPTPGALTDAILALREADDADPDLIRRLELAEATQGQFDFVTAELILPERIRLPMLVVDEQGGITASRFVEAEDLTPEFAANLARIHDPIPIHLGPDSLGVRQFVLYGESNLITALRYFPYAQFAFILLLIGIGFTGYRSIVTSEQSNLWVGMAKEAAHQLGTPLSGMYGWIELLKERLQTQDDRTIAMELERDVDRLTSVAERFNKIGSSPELTPQPAIPVMERVVAYMERRLPRKGLDLTLQTAEGLDPAREVRLNAELFGWAIENLIKNAADAGASTITLAVSEEAKRLTIDIRDDGSGVDRKLWKEIFRPGYSTKKRGWGLGLSLTRRILEDYHGGTVGVARSEPGKGTTMRLTLPLQPAA